MPLTETELYVILSALGLLILISMLTSSNRRKKSIPKDSIFVQQTKGGHTSSFSWEADD